MKKSMVSRKIVLALSEPLGLVSEPYAIPARVAGLSQSQLITCIADYQRRGIIRRMGIVYSHLKVGFVCNALVVWKVEAQRINAVGEIFARIPAISHCYARQAYPRWPYNLYTMVHAKSRKSCLQVIRLMARMSGIKEYKPLFTVKEFKKIKSNLREIL